MQSAPGQPLDIIRVRDSHVVHLFELAAQLLPPGPLTVKLWVVAMKPEKGMWVFLWGQDLGSIWLP